MDRKRAPKYSFLGDTAAAFLTSSHQKPADSILHETFGDAASTWQEQDWPDKVTLPLHKGCDPRFSPHKSGISVALHVPANCL